MTDQRSGSATGPESLDDANALISFIDNHTSRGETIIYYNHVEDRDLLESLGQDANLFRLGITVNNVMLQSQPLQPARINDRAFTSWYVFGRPEGRPQTVPRVAWFDDRLGGHINEVPSMLPSGHCDVAVFGHRILRAHSRDDQAELMSLLLNILTPTIGRVIVAWSPLHLETAGQMSFTSKSRHILRQQWFWKQSTALDTVAAEIQDFATALNLVIQTPFTPVSDTPGSGYIDLMTTVPPIFTQPGRVELLERCKELVDRMPKAEEDMPDAVYRITQIRYRASLDNTIRVVRREDDETIYQLAQQFFPRGPPMTCLSIDYAQAAQVLGIQLAMSQNEPEPELPESGQLWLPEPWYLGYVLLRPN